MMVFNVQAQSYERNKAVPVEKVLFGTVLSVRNITEKEIIEDQKNGWNTFGGAVLGGIIGNQFGSGSGRDLATIVGALIGASIADENNRSYRERHIQLVEIMIRVEGGDEYMVIQDRDPTMLFHADDDIRMVMLSTGSVRIDKQM